MSEFQDVDVHISDYWHVLNSRKQIIFIFLIVVVCLTTVANFFIKPVYKTKATILVENPGVQVVGIGENNNASLQGTSSSDFKDIFPGQGEILSSRANYEEVFVQLKLGEQKEFQHKTGKIKSTMRNLSQVLKVPIPVIGDIVELVRSNLAKQAADTFDPIDLLEKKIQVKADRDLRQLVVLVKAGDPQLAADIANKLTEIYIRNNLFFLTRNESLNLMKTEYFQLMAKLSDYEKVYKEKHPKLIELRAKIHELIQNIDSINRVTLKDYQNAPKTIFALTKQNNVKILDPAKVEPKPDSPNIMMNIAMSILLGLWGGVSLAFIVNYMDDLVHSVEDVIKSTGWFFLGYVQEIKRNLKKEERNLIVHKFPRDPISEAYRAIRTSLLFQATADHSIKVISITSWSPGEGKSTSTCNIAIAIAQTGAKVLLVDAELRKSRLNEVFEISDNRGLAAYLNGEINFEETLHETMVPNLTFACAGSHPINPSELLLSPKMVDYLEIARHKYQYVILDTAPVGLVTDATILAPLVDATVIVVDRKKTPRRAILRIVQKLKHAKSKLTAFLLNRANEQSDEYYYDRTS